MATKNVTFNASTPILSISEVAELICATGHEITWLVQGDMGSGKTSLLKTIVERTKMRGVYFDCTTKDLGDLYLPRIKDADDGDFVSFVPNEEFGIHFHAPIVLMLDEIGKNRSIQNPLLRTMQERYIGSRKLPEGSIVFATTNLGAENVGDMLPPHARNRIGVVRMRKPNAAEWMQWANENDQDPALVAAVHENKSMLDSFTDVENPDENPYIYDPRVSTRTSFVTPRSMSKLSDLLKKRHVLSENVVMQGAMGLVGAAAAKQIMLTVQIGDQVPKYERIVADPINIPVPASAGAQIVCIIKCLQNVDQQTFNACFTYIKRMPMEMQALFTEQLLGMQTKAKWLVTQSSFTEFAKKNFGLFVK
jgi:hypothetical protein